MQQCSAPVLLCGCTVSLTQTGTRSVFSPRAVRRIRSFCSGGKAVVDMMLECGVGRSVNSVSAVYSALSVAMQVAQCQQIAAQVQCKSAAGRVVYSAKWHGGDWEWCNRKGAPLRPLTQVVQFSDTVRHPAACCPYTRFHATTHPSHLYVGAALLWACAV